MKTILVLKKLLKKLPLIIIKLFPANVSILYPLNTVKNQILCSDFFGGYELGTLAINVLIRIYFSLDYNIMDIKFSIEKVCSVVLLSRTLSSNVKLCKYEYWTEKDSFIKTMNFWKNYQSSTGKGIIFYTSLKYNAYRLLSIIISAANTSLLHLFLRFDHLMSSSMYQNRINLHSNAYEYVNNVWTQRTKEN